MSPLECGRCGALSIGSLCEYCGAPLASADPAAERAALDELHSLLGGKGPNDQVVLLARAFLPSHPQVLIEAGLRCVALLGEGSSSRLADALVGRLEAVAARLRLGDRDPECLRAAEELDRHLERYRRNRRRSRALGLGLILTLVAAVGWLLVALIRWLWGR